jgi:hypothetical protein
VAQRMSPDEGSGIVLDSLSRAARAVVATIQSSVRHRCFIHVVRILTVLSPCYCGVRMHAYALEALVFQIASRRKKKRATLYMLDSAAWDCMRAHTYTVGYVFELRSAT